MKRAVIGGFERYLSLWVVLCMVVGVALGRLFPGVVDVLRRIELGAGSQINVPIAILIWLMIYPDDAARSIFASRARRAPPARGILVTLFVNWLVKPFSMALLGWLFFKHCLRISGSRPISRISTWRASSFSRRLPARRWSSSGPSSRGRSGLHAGPGLIERPDHAPALRAARDAARERSQRSRTFHSACSCGDAS